MRADEAELGVRVKELDREEEKLSEQMDSAKAERKELVKKQGERRSAEEKLRLKQARSVLCGKIPKSSVRRSLG